MFDKSVKEVMGVLKSSESGLSSKEASKRLSEYGTNIILAKKGISPIIVFLSQFKSFIVWILLGAMVISFFIGEKLDSLVILIIVVLNAVIGFIQEYKAERAIDALKKITAQKSVVIRNGKEETIDSSELVPGDIVVFSVGEKIGADCRMIESVNLEVNESVLTGESLPVKKQIDKLTGKVALADRINMVFSGTSVTTGRGRGIVIGTGMNTEIGKIAGMIQKEKIKATPLQEKLARLGRVLGIITLCVCALVFISGVVSGRGVFEMFLASVSLAVAAIPEGLPAVVTISLALGVQRMVKRNSLVRRLPSVETLGSTTVICTDKTGTLTCNEMTVRKVYVNGSCYDVTGEGYSFDGGFSIKGKSVDSKKFETLLLIGALNNDAKVEKEIIGDPTEAALIVSAGKAGLKHDSVMRKYKRLDEKEFTSERKRMSTSHMWKGKQTTFCKGAPDVILDLCDRILINGKVRKLTASDKKKIHSVNEEFASSALRVLGFAYRIEKHITEKNMIFVGMQGMIDPPRAGVKDAVTKCHEAGIKVVMITGDHITTARAVAREIGIKGDAIVGAELNKLKSLSKIVDKVAIYARVNPEHKSKIVDALRAKGYVIAMTGDGVNDAPALKKADIGISMGITGTDVAKEASDMILTDDHFTSIVSAVEEGRGVYDNIKKFFAFLISGNLGEVFIIFFAILLGLPLPLTATQILLINLVTDGLPAVALGADPFEPHAMRRKPRSRNEPIRKGLSHFIVFYPIIMITTVLSLFYYVFTSTGNLVKAQTVTFLSIAFFEMFQAFASRSTIYPAFKVGIFKNPFLVVAVMLSLIVTIAVVYLPLFQEMFNTTALALHEILWLIGLSSIGFIYLEIHKLIASRKAF